MNSKTVKELRELAKDSGIAGWHAMRKDQLVRSLNKLAKPNSTKSRSARSKSASAKSTASNGAASKTQAAPMKASSNGNGNGFSGATKSRNDSASPKPQPKLQSKIKSSQSRLRTAAPAEPASAIAKKIIADRERRENLKNLSLISSLDREQQPPAKDRLVLIVRDSFWMQAYWEITKSTVQRAKVALEGSWHLAKPVLRLLEVTSEGNTNSVENFIQEIEIHGGVKNWFINVKPPTKKYRLAIGYVIPGQKFHLICKSNQVSPPAASSGSVDENWTDITNDVEKYYALSGGYDDNTVSGDLQPVFEEKARQPMHAPAFERLGSGINGHAAEFEFHVEAHMIVYGTTNPNGSVMIGGEPVRLQRDGSFSIKVDLPDRRQVLPVVASSRDGTQQRTTVIAIERNTKVMEAITSDIDSD